MVVVWFCGAVISSGLFWFVFVLLGFGFFNRSFSPYPHLRSRKFCVKIQSQFCFLQCIGTSMDKVEMYLYIPAVCLVLVYVNLV